MILRDGCNTSYDLAPLFRGRSSTLETWDGKIGKRTRLAVSHNSFVFRRTGTKIGR